MTKVAVNAYRTIFYKIRYVNNAKNLFSTVNYARFYKLKYNAKPAVPDSSKMRRKILVNARGL